jgi:hypothetical protein
LYHGYLENTVENTERCEFEPPLFIFDTLFVYLDFTWLVFCLHWRKEQCMQIERTDKEVIIRLPASVNTEDLQELLNYARYKELTSKFSVSQKQADKLASQVNKSWWTKNRKRLLK